MKPDPNQLFGNIFNDRNIITERLLTFGNNTQNNLIAANTSNQYDELIALLNKSLPPLQTEVSDVDNSIAVQLGKTLTNDQVLKLFKKTMSDKEGFIADVLGGRGTPAYLEFYPADLTEYSAATKSNMDTLTKRVNLAATKYTLELGVSNTALLAGFQSSWQTSRADQQQQIGTVNDNRTDRTAARTDAEIALVQVLHGISQMFAPDIDKCNSFFSFNLLFPQTKRKRQLFTGVLQPGEAVVVLNRTLKNGVGITARNTDDNASWSIYLNPTEKTEPPADPIVVQPLDSKDIKPSQLGSKNSTFLIIRNMSEVNEGKYELEITGMKAEGSAA